MVLLLIEMGYQLDEVIFFNTGMEFEAIYNVRDRLIPILKERGIKYTELEPQKPFLYNMLERPVESKQKGCHCGYGWCGGVCRWGTTEKNRIIDEYKAGINDEVYEYVGIAADEAWRAKWKNARYGEYGDVFQMEEVFKNERLEEVVQLSLFDG